MVGTKFSISVEATKFTVVFSDSVEVATTGAGVASAGFPSLKGQWAGYTETQLKAYREGSRANAMMNGVAQNLSDADIRAVSSYVGGLQ